MSITPRFTTAAKHTLKTSRLVARGRGVPQADHLDILLAALAVAGTALFLAVTAHLDRREV